MQFDICTKIFSGKKSLEEKKTSHTHTNNNRYVVLFNIQIKNIEECFYNPEDQALYFKPYKHFYDINFYQTYILIKRYLKLFRLFYLFWSPQIVFLYLVIGRVLF